VFVSVSFFFLAADIITITITVVTEGRLAVRRRPAYVHIETNGLHSSGTKLFSLGLFVFIECWGVCRCADLDDIRKKETRWRRRGRFFNGFPASPEAERIRGYAQETASISPLAAGGRSKRRVCSGGAGECGSSSRLACNWNHVIECKGAG
jgi:hypothetical protein